MCIAFAISWNSPLNFEGARGANIEIDVVSWLTVLSWTLLASCLTCSQRATCQSCPGKKKLDMFLLDWVCPTSTSSTWFPHVPPMSCNSDARWWLAGTWIERFCPYGGQWSRGPKWSLEIIRCFVLRAKGLPNITKYNTITYDSSIDVVYLQIVWYIHPWFMKLIWTQVTHYHSILEPYMNAALGLQAVGTHILVPLLQWSLGWCCSRKWLLLGCATGGCGCLCLLGRVQLIRDAPYTCHGMGNEP